MSKILQLGAFLFGPPNIFDSLLPIKETKSVTNSIKNSFKKELKNTGTKKLNDDILADEGLNIIGKRIKKGVSSIKGLGTTLTNNGII